jgi:1-phosphatidylinositol-3-phosphate 5-kinase
MVHYQEKGHLEKAINQVMETCNPNVIMVEKTVSRDIQELLLNQGVTLVLDMRINRLQRIARCSGSPIVSVSEILTMPKLKQCDYFHIEKFVEEHNHTGEGGKRPAKTLMFLEGFPKPLGCTVSFSPFTFFSPLCVDVILKVHVGPILSTSKPDSQFIVNMLGCIVLTIMGISSAQPL